MKVFAGLFLMLLLSVTAVAADVDGEWSGSMAGPGGDLPVAFKFKADGAKLTGSTTGLDGAEIQIKDGKIDGANIAFSMSLDFGGTPFMLTYKGVVAADQIKMSGDAAGTPFEFLLKKAKTTAVVDGSWTGSFAGPGGDIPASFKFKADGAKLTGSTTGLDGAEVPIKDGKIDGANIAFSVSFDFGGTPFVMSYKGVVSADQIKLTGEAAGTPFDLIVKKSK